VRPSCCAHARARRAFEAERPALRRYAPYLDRLEVDRPFTLGDEVEDALAEFGGPLGQFARARNTLVGSDVRFEPVSTEGRARGRAVDHPRARVDPDREVRRQAWSHYADGFLGVRDTLAELYLGMVQTTCADARVRGYASGEARALARHRVEPSVLDATLEAFTRRLPVWHRYWEVRRRLSASRASSRGTCSPRSGTVPHVPFERAAAWIVDSSAPLGEAYQAHLRRGLLEERWVDKPANARQARRRLLLLDAGRAAPVRVRELHRRPARPRRWRTSSATPCTRCSLTPSRTRSTASARCR
jgi:oligoendopeptidase F